MNEFTPKPIKDDAGKVIGVSVPIIDKALYFADVPEGDKYMNWDKAMAYAKSIGRELPTRDEMYIIAYYKDVINAIALDAGHPDFLDDWTWSSTEGSTSGAWYVSFGTGYISNTYKCNTIVVVRPVAAL